MLCQEYMFYLLQTFLQAQPAKGKYEKNVYKNSFPELCQNYGQHCYTTNGDTGYIIIWQESRLGSYKFGLSLLIGVW